MRWHPPVRRAGMALVYTAALLLGQPLDAPPAAAATLSEPEIFGTTEIFSPNLRPFTKWNDVVRRTVAQEQAQSRLCAQDAAQPDCVMPRWQRLVAELRGLPLRARIERVNRELNQVSYVPAVANWHDPDHWETPFEFLAKGGQCEDYAIAKFMALAASGVAAAEMRLVVVHDNVSALDHAIAVVYVDGDALVLDNQIKDVEPASAIHRYAPYYSINFSGWWYHRPSA